MTISVIIPTLHEEKNIGQLLERLRAQTLQPTEVLVVDGHSEDNTKQIAKKFEKVNVYSSVRGVGRQRDFGGKNANGEILIFLDADVQPTSDFIQNALTEFKARKLDIACPRFSSAGKQLLIKGIYFSFYVLFRALELFLPSGGGSCIIVKKSVFDQVGGFRGDLQFDDIEFIRRASKVGKFRILSTSLIISDRRFQKYGILPTLFQYAILSVFFTFGMFTLANKVPYTFGKYEK